MTSPEVPPKEGRLACFFFPSFFFLFSCAQASSKILQLSIVVSLVRDKVVTAEPKPGWERLGKPGER